MKISNSKKQLAKIISENGGWPHDAWWAAQCKSDGTVSFYGGEAPYRDGDFWWGSYCDGLDIPVATVLPHWHQTILSRDEYFHLYPAHGAVVVENKTTCHLYVTDKPTIEQLAAEYRNRKDYAERKQQEADAAKAEAEAALEKLYHAGIEIGLDIAIASNEPELQVGDEIEYLDGALSIYVGMCGVVDSIDRGGQCDDYIINVRFLNGATGWCSDWRFIRRPAKEADNA